MARLYWVECEWDIGLNGCSGSRGCYSSYEAAEAAVRAGLANSCTDDDWGPGDKFEEATRNNLVDIEGIEG